MSTVYREVAKRMRDVSRRTVDHHVTHMEFAEVKSAAPLLADTGDMLLDDEDLTLGKWAEVYDSVVGIDVGDTLIVERVQTDDDEEDNDWVVVDVVSDTTIEAAFNISTKAPLDSPTFTGDPKAPTPATGDNDTSIATTAFVKAQGYAALASPTFTGDPKAPTPATADNDTSLATTAFVKAQGYTTQAALDTHKTSADHDGRYYTETEVDAFILAAKARANHTGTQIAATISDFVTTVRAQRLDQMAAPAADVDYGGFRLVNLGDPGSAAHAVNRGWMDAAIIGAKARANHTGTQPAATISDLAAVVKAYRLDEFAVPTVDVSFGSRKLTSLAAGTAATDAVNKTQLDAKADAAGAVMDGDAAGGDLGGTFPNPTVEDLTGGVGVLGGRGVRINDFHVLWSRNNRNLQLRTNYDPTTDRLIDTASPGWMLALHEDVSDRIAVRRAAPTVGAPTYVLLGTVSSAGALDFIGALTQNGVAVVLTTDSRLSDARTPTAHATSHKLGGSDAVRLDELALPTAAVALNAQRLSNVGAPLSSSDGIRRSELDTHAASGDHDTRYHHAVDSTFDTGAGTSLAISGLDGTAHEGYDIWIEWLYKTTLAAEAAPYLRTTPAASLYRCMQHWSSVASGGALAAIASQAFRTGTGIGFGQTVGATAGGGRVRCLLTGRLLTSVPSSGDQRVIFNGQVSMRPAVANTDLSFAGGSIFGFAVLASNLTGLDFQFDGAATGRYVIEPIAGTL